VGLLAAGWMAGPAAVGGTALAPPSLSKPNGSKRPERVCSPHMQSSSAG
jgi:hypothetical protein